MPICQYINLTGPNKGHICGKSIKVVDAVYCYNHKRVDPAVLERNKDKIEYLKKKNGYINTNLSEFSPMSDVDLIDNFRPQKVIKKNIVPKQEVDPELEILRFNSEQQPIKTPVIKKPVIKKPVIKKPVIKAQPLPEPVEETLNLSNIDEDLLWDKLFMTLNGGLTEGIDYLNECKKRKLVTNSEYNQLKGKYNI